MGMKKLMTCIGVDRSVLYALAGRGWNLVSGVATLLLVARNLTLDEQGYYYTFASLLAMQIFFELGMSTVVLQFASHEVAHLTWTDAGTLVGDPTAKTRLRSLIVLMFKWYGVIAILFVLVIAPVGFVFFSTNSAESLVNWHWAWIWLVLSTAINVFLMPFLSILEGCGRVMAVSRMRLYQNIIGSMAAWTVLLLGGGLLAMPAMSTGLAIVVLIWLWMTNKDFFRNILMHEYSGIGVNWRKEIWPFQWKIAISWLSGYFIFQLFTPILFVYRGSIEAGQMGMSISIANALISIAIAWMNTKAPIFGSFVARKDYVGLDKLFAISFSRSLIFMVILGAGLCLFNYIIHAYSVSFSARILDPFSFLLLVVATIFVYVTYALATYLRAHKEDPFLILSLISAALIGSSTILFVDEYGATGLMLAYAMVYAVVGVGGGSYIFYSKRRDWHE
jgi:O-antigen/teichoic acid export membrane protein